MIAAIRRGAFAALSALAMGVVVLNIADARRRARGPNADVAQVHRLAAGLRGTR